MFDGFIDAGRMLRNRTYMHDDEFIVTVTHSSVTTIYFSEI
jgi:hypothetical protein